MPCVAKPQTIVAGVPVFRATSPLAHVASFEPSPAVDAGTRCLGSQPLHRHTALGLAEENAARLRLITCVRETERSGIVGCGVRADRPSRREYVPRVPRHFVVSSIDPAVCHLTPRFRSFRPELFRPGTPARCPALTREPGFLYACARGLGGSVDDRGRFGCIGRSGRPRC